MTGWLFEPLCCLADFPCESKLSQIKSSPHRNLSGLPVILAKTTLRSKTHVLLQASNVNW